MIETVLVKLASRCNLDCGYCYVYHMGDDGWRAQPKRMALETVEVLAGRLTKLAEAQGHPLGVVFHGGEPLLVGASRFEDVCSILRKALPEGCSLALQTNGTLLSSAIIDTCVRYEVGVSISLDGPAEVHDRQRRDRRGRGSHSAAIAGIGRLTNLPASRRLFSGVLAVIDVESDPIEVYEALKATGAPSMDLLYRDGNHEVMPPGKGSFETDEYGRWMIQLLDHYLADPRPTPIRVLDDMLRLLLGGHATKEGLGTTAYGILVVESDGTIAKNDTLKSAHVAADQFDQKRSIYDGELAEILSKVDYMKYEVAQARVAAGCRGCPDFAVCGGGMPAHRWSEARGFDNPSVFCADQKRLIAHMRACLLRHGLSADAA